MPHRRPRLVNHLFRTAACSFALAAAVASAQSAPPRIFYTDLLSGPARGGQSGQGAFVTLYGSGFGTAQGSSSVTIGGQPAYAYPRWSAGTITIQLAATTQSGPIVVHLQQAPTATDTPSNPSSFTIVPGHIFFVSPLGDDAHNGTFPHPWQTLLHTIHALRPGDIAYAMDAVHQSTLDKYDSALSIQTSGAAGAPLALVAYPGATVTIGTFAGPLIAARTPNIDRTSDHWVLAGLTFQGAQEALDLTASTDWRIIANDFSCPHGFGPTGCVQTSQATHIAFLGNHVHDVAQPGTTKAYQGVYFSTDSNSIDVGWNLIEHIHSCRGLQFHSSPIDPGTGHNQFDLHIHNNTIHDTVCDGINLATIDPSRGPVEVLDNLVYNAGTGPDPEDGSADYACLYVQGGSEAGPPGSGTVLVANNTFYHCGARGNTDSGALSLSPGSPSESVRLQNNIIVLAPHVPLLSPNSTATPLQSPPQANMPDHFNKETNLLWPPSTAPQLCSAHAIPALFTCLHPRFTDPAHGDFSLLPTSPAFSPGRLPPGAPAPTSLQPSP